MLTLFRGKPLLQHVYERVRQSPVLAEVLVATDNQAIQESASGFGAKVILTPKDCSCGSDRVAYVAGQVDADIIVNIQGDQPRLPFPLIGEVAEPLLRRPELVMTTPVVLSKDKEEFLNPNVVKAVMDSKGFALYFSRSSVPCYRQGGVGPQGFYKHIGVYAFRKEFLLQFKKFKAGRLEKIEGLEQLRVLENGYRILMVTTKHNSPSVDTVADLEMLSRS